MSSNQPWPLGKDNPDCICSELPNVNCPVHIIKTPNQDNNFEQTIRAIFLKNTMPEPNDPELTEFDVEAIIKELAISFQSSLEEAVRLARIDENQHWINHCQKAIDENDPSKNSTTSKIFKHRIKMHNERIDELATLTKDQEKQ